MTCEWRFALDASTPVELITDHADRIMSSLLDQEALDPRICDAAVSLDLGTRTVLVGVSVAGDDYEGSVAHALAAIRSAVHTAGGTTTAWSGSSSNVESLDGDVVVLEPHDFTVHA